MNLILWKSRKTAAQAIGFAICITAAVSLARANDDRVDRRKLPEGVRVLFDREVDAAAGKDAQFYKTDHGEFFVHFTLPNGLRLEMKVRKDGGFINVEPTKNQPDLRKEDVKRYFDHYVAEREGRRHVEVEHVKVVEVRPDIRYRPEDEAAYRAAVDRARDAQRLRDEEAAHDRARRMSEREAAEFYADRRFERLDLARTTYGAGSALRDASRDGTDVEYYRFTKAGAPFYAAKYTTPRGRRVEVIVDEVGQPVDRIELYDRPLVRADIHDRDIAWDRDHRWDRQEMNRLWLPDRARAALDDQTLGSTDVDYFRYVEAGRTYYAARFTTVSGRRLDCRRATGRSRCTL
jgi:hypothetical protein